MYLGKIYTFGRNDDGQLGVGDDFSAKPTPQLLPTPKHVKDISANGAFTLAITGPPSEGDADDDDDDDDDGPGNNLYMWGYGEMGQLANGGEDASEPFRVVLKGREVYQASAGGQHTLLLLNVKQE
jgi:regulator of chromosome condensation